VIGGDMEETQPAVDAADAALGEDARTLYDRAPCGYLTTTPDGMILKVNQTFLTWTGHAGEELVGRRTFSSLLSGGGRIYHDTHFAPLLQMQGSVREIALDVVRADGSRIPVLVNATLDRDTADGPLVRVVVFDATERREYERELLRAKQRAEESEARARSLAWTLQQTLIPPHPPSIPGLDVAAVYRPAGTGEEVGGDFYDVFELAQDDWVVVLGDVCGKGVDAAVVTSLVRHTLRAVTIRRAGAGETLRALNKVLLNHESDRFCTVAVLRLRRRGPVWQLSLSLGGHPHPLLLRQGEAPTLLGTPGSLVGVLTEPEFTETRVDLEPGSIVALYTDGVTEGRRGDELYGEVRLRQTAQLHAESPTRVTEGILADVLDFQGGRARDDIAVVAVGVPEAVTSPGTAWPRASSGR
jgi:sigma-B regulation protein RsbU (phosphoserine phosphatase)